MVLFLVCLSQLIVYASSIELQSFGFKTSKDQSAEITETITATLWFNYTIFSCDMYHVLEIRSYVCNIDGSKSWVDSFSKVAFQWTETASNPVCNVAQFKIMIDNSQSTTPLMIDSVQFTDTNGDIYGADQFCIPNDVNIKSYYSPIVHTSVCDDDFTAHSAICVDNDMSTCAPGKQAVYLDINQPGQYINDAVWVNATNMYTQPVHCTTAPPSNNPTDIPTNMPTTSNPTHIPTAAPSFSPTTRDPTLNPTTHPSFSPTTNPSSHPTFNPTTNPSSHPTFNPTTNPATNPSFNPTTNPSTNLSFNPTTHPSSHPTFSPTIYPSLAISDLPTQNPSFSVTTDETTAPSLSDIYRSTTRAPFVNLTNANTTHVPTVFPSINATESSSFDPTISPIFNGSSFDDVSIYPTISPTENSYVSHFTTGTISGSTDEASFLIFDVDGWIVIIAASVLALMCIISCVIMVCCSKYKQKKRDKHYKLTCNYQQLGDEHGNDYYNDPKHKSNHNKIANITDNDDDDIDVPYDAFSL